MNSNLGHSVSQYEMPPLSCLGLSCGNEIFPPVDYGEVSYPPMTLKDNYIISQINWSQICKSWDDLKLKCPSKDLSVLGLTPREGMAMQCHCIKRYTRMKQLSSTSYFLMII